MIQKDPLEQYSKMAESIPKKPQANLVEFETDEEIVDVDKIEDKISSNVTCVSDHIDSVLKIFDTKTCLDMLRGYYEAYNEVVLPEGTECNIYGCEFDYSSNTYRLMVILSFETKTIGENFLIVKVDGSTGFPKILSVK